MYFGRGHHDPSASNESQARLQQFSGATAISSNAYFGREEEEDEEHEANGGQDYGDMEAIAGLERGVRDMASRVMGSQEVQNLTEQVRAGALKVSRVLGLSNCETRKSKRGEIWQGMMLERRTKRGREPLLARILVLQDKTRRRACRAETTDARR